MVPKDQGTLLADNVVLDVQVQALQYSSLPTQSRGLCPDCSHTLSHCSLVRLPSSNSVAVFRALLPSSSTIRWVVSKVKSVAAAACPQSENSFNMSGDGEGLQSGSEVMCQHLTCVIQYKYCFFWCTGKVYCCIRSDLCIPSCMHAQL